MRVLVLTRAGCSLALAVSALPCWAHAQAPTVKSPIEYEVAFPNAAHHEAEVTITFRDLNPGTLELRMSRTSPGRYALHEFAKNVYGVKVAAADGSELGVTRPNPHQWNVLDHRGFVRVTYTLYGDRADGTYAGIDRSHGHLNMPAAFMWARSLDDRPIRIRFTPPAGSGWRVATQLAPTDDPFVFSAPDLEYFLDSPTVVSDFTEIAWTVPTPDGDRRFRIALQHDGSAEDADRYAAGARAIVREAGALFGEYPTFDYGLYTFLAVYLPWVNGDGMEHRNSTMLTSTGNIRSNVMGLWGTVAHEFIHAWNVERIRPRDLQPFDFEEANMSRGLWFAEGFTSYLDDVLLRRAELIDTEDFAGRIGGAISFVTNAPGRRFFSPVEMSMQAPFVDAAASVDPNNRGNTFISYYTWGSVVGLGLDLELRTRFTDLSLDHYMRAMWDGHGRTQIPYTVDDLEAVLAELTGDAGFAAEFFSRYVRGREVPDFERLLASGGMILRTARPGQATLGGVQLRYSVGGATVAGATTVGTPIYDAGLDRGDRIVSLEGRDLSSADVLAELLRGKSPGDRISVTYVSRGSQRTAEIVLGGSPALTVVPFEAEGRPVSDDVRRFRQAWLEPKGR